MFEGKVLFVVGAGASVDFGFPMGDGLKDRIATKLNIRYRDGYSLESGDPQIVDALKVIAKRQGQTSINPYLPYCRSIAGAMSQAISIDNYLHTHSDVPELVLVGKLAIAASILEAERTSNIYIEAHERTFDFHETKNVWHNTFCKILTENVQRSSLDTLFENVAFITFNYDRCIEHYISHWLANYMRISLEEAQTLTKAMTIFHPYGQVGKLPWQTSAEVTVAFGGEVYASQLLSVAEQIRTFTERVENDATLAPMRAHIVEADTVVYMGFSYGSMNLELLNIEQDGAPKNVIGTAFNISQPNKEAIKTHLFRSLTGPAGTKIRRCDLENMTCAALLNDYWRVLGG